MKFRTIGSLIVLAFVFFLTIQPPIDLDLGWHLRYGEYFFQTGHVQRENAYSFVWPDYKWVEASWGFDLIAYQLFVRFGFIGISLAGAAITTLIFWCITSPLKRLSFFSLLFLAAMFLSHTKPLYMGAFRAQTLSSLFFAIVLILWQRFSDPRNKLNTPWITGVLPILFLLWANLHGGFALGLLLLSLMWFTTGILLIAKRVKHFSFELMSVKQWRVLGIALFLSWLTPLVNPWGMRLYEETFRHSMNRNLTVIVEWMPLYSWPIETTVATLVVLFVLAISVVRKKVWQIPYIVAFLMTTYLGFSAIRFMINFGIMATYFLAENIPHLQPFLKHNIWRKGAPAVLVLFILSDLVVFQRYFTPVAPGTLPTSWKQLCDLTRNCSEEVTAAMRADLPGGPGYHPYNYGGYLIWRAPEVKTFVDGRMAAWEDHGKTPPVLDGDWIILQKNPIAFRKFESTYHFRWMIVPTPAYISNYLDDLVVSGSWERRYRDEYYSYYVKK